MRVKSIRLQFFLKQYAVVNGIEGGFLDLGRAHIVNEAVIDFSVPVAYSLSGSGNLNVQEVT